MPDPDPTDPLLALAARMATAYRRSVPGRLQRPELPFEAMRERFREPCPEVGGEPEALLRDLAERIDPGLNAMTGGRFFGWVIGASDRAGLAADWLAGAWGQNNGNHEGTPGVSAVEEVAARWLLDLLHLPGESSVGFVTGATMANFVAIAAARGELLRRVGWDVERDGLIGAPAIHVIAGRDAHSTVFSALRYAGLGAGRAHRVATDRNGAMDPDALREALRGIPEGPLLLLLQAGQLNTGAFDPFGPLMESVRGRPNTWVHVDGAFGLWARAHPELCPRTDGVELADSWATDGHKWLQTPYDCGYAICRDAEAHRRAMTIAASYLPVSGAEERDPAQLVPELSRRARGVATWMQIKTLGRTGIGALVAHHCALARHFAALLGAEPGVQVLNDVNLNQVVVRFGGEGDGGDPSAGDQATDEVLARVREEGTCFIGGARWHGRRVMRLSISSSATTRDDIAASANSVLRAWRAVRG